MANPKKPFSLSLFLLLLILAVLAAILVFSASLRKLSSSAQNTPVACGGDNPQASTGEFNPQELSGIWLGKTIAALPQPLAEQPIPDSVVLGESSDEKWIEIDLDQQRLFAHQGDQIVYETAISSGKFAPTPTGEYRIWYKTRYTKMEGGVKGTGTYYYLPNVPYTMFFYKGYGVHGTYWHNNFGQPMSHGCVNTPTPMAATLFDWADPVVPEGKNSIMSSADNPGTRVVVHGTAPRN